MVKITGAVKRDEICKVRIKSFITPFHHRVTISFSSTHPLCLLYEVFVFTLYMDPDPPSLGSKAHTNSKKSLERIEY